MIISKMRPNFKNLFLLVTVVTVSAVVFLIGKVFSHKGSNSLMSQLGLINSVSADDLGGGGEAGCCGSGASESSGGGY